MLTGGRDKLSKSEKTHRALLRVGQSINQSIERFASVGEAIGDDNPEIKIDMVDACKDVRTAGCIFEQLCDLTADSGAYNSRCYSDQRGLYRGARNLLSSVTRVLLIADAVVVDQLLAPKDRISISLNRLENVANFTEFVKAYSQFGYEMVELAHLISDRSNNLKDDRRRAEIGSARRFLERSTLLLLTSSKTCLRHPDSQSAKDNRDTVFNEIRKTIDSIHRIVKEGVLPNLIHNSFDSSGYSRRSHGRSHVSRYSSAHSSSSSSSSSGPVDSFDPLPTTFNAIKRFEELVDMSRVTLCKGVYRERLSSAFDHFVELTQQFTDSAYTRHDNRQKILLLCDKIKIELNQLIRLGVILDEAGSTNPTEDLEESIMQTIKAVNDVKYQLLRTALDQADEVFKMTDELSFINYLRIHSLSGDTERLNDYFKLFTELCDHLYEVCHLLHNVSTSETLIVYSKSTESHINIFSAQVLNACLTLSAHPNSRIAKDNVEVFLDFWIALYSDVHQYSKDIGNLTNGLGCLNHYNDTGIHNNTSPLSNNQLQLPSSSSPKGTVSQSHSPQQQQQQQQQPQSNLKHPPHQQLSQLHQQAPPSNNITITTTSSATTKSDDKIIINSTELKVISNGIEVDPQKWTASEDNDIVRKAKAMVQMALSMYQFTQGEGELKTTQDLFTQAEFVAEEANKFYKLVRHFSYLVPSGSGKKDLLDQLDKVPTFVQQLQFTVKQATVGKAATFTKVDNVIKEAKNLMIYVCLSTNTALGVAAKHNLDMGAARTRSRTLSPSGRFGDDSGGSEGLSSGLGSKSGTASSDPNI